jgi:hypothetical protein
MDPSEIKIGQTVWFLHDKGRWFNFGKVVAIQQQPERDCLPQVCVEMDSGLRIVYPGQLFPDESTLYLERGKQLQAEGQWLLKCAEANLTKSKKIQKTQDQMTDE